MRILLAVGWLFVGLAGLIFHLGPGEKQLELDKIDSTLKLARSYSSDEKWADAVDTFDEALAMLPDDRKSDEYVVRLEKAQAQMMAKQLPDARLALEGLLQEVEADKESDAKLKSEVRSTLANSQYYMTWLMRLEGLPKTDWEPEIEAARQNYLVVSERAEAEHDAGLAKRSKEDLESAIRLARMDLKDLQGLPLPSQ